MNVKWMLRRLYESFDGEGSDLVGESFDMTAALDSISNDLFGQAEEEPSAEEDPAKETPPADPAPAPTPPVEPAPSSDFPKTWKKEAEVHWANLPPEVKAEVLRRETDMFRGLEQYKEAATYGRAFQQALSPFLPDIQAAGLDPALHVQNLLQAHHVLSRGTLEQKQAVVRALLEDAGVSLDQGEAPYVDPAVADLRQRVEQLQSQTRQREEQEARQVKEATMKTIETFFADPVHKHAAAVSQEMAALLKSGAAADLKSAYEKAIWLNPVTREQVLAEQREAAAAAEEKAKQEKAAAAAKAASGNLRTSQRSGGGTASKGRTMDETLQETYRQLTAKN